MARPLVSPASPATAAASPQSRSAGTEAGPRFPAVSAGLPCAAAAATAVGRVVEELVAPVEDQVLVEHVEMP